MLAIIDIEYKKEKLLKMYVYESNTKQIPNDKNKDIT